MRSGKKTLGSINRGLSKLQKDIRQVEQEVDTSNSALVSLRKQQIERYRRIASIRLDSMISGELGSALGAVELRVKELLAQRETALDELKARINANRTLQSELQDQRDAAGDVLADATEALDTAEAAAQARLEPDPSYQAQLSRARQAQHVAEQAAEKTAQSEDVRTEKGVPYENDALFSYLWERGYGTTKYSANPLTRMLDGWVARLCNFRDARANYAMLLEIPKRLQQHADHVAGLADEEFAALTVIEEAAAEREGVPALREKVTAAQADVDRVDEQIEAAEDALRDLQNERSQFTSGEDQYLRECIDTFTDTFEREKLLTLYEYARATATTEDDLLVRDLEEAENTVHELTTTISEQKKLRQGYQSRLEELESVRRQFKGQRYDSVNSGFRNGALVSMLVNEFLQGAVSSKELWRTIEREQRHRRSRANPDFGSGAFFPRRGTWHIPNPRGGMGGGIRGGLGSRRGGGLGGGIRFPRGGGGLGGGFRTGGGF